jgi:hypothetical protein
MVHLGVVNPPSASGVWDKKVPHTVIEKTPVVAEKLYLRVGDDGSLGVFVPQQKTDFIGCDVAGVKLAGLLIDAAPKESPYLIQVGAPKSSSSKNSSSKNSSSKNSQRHNANPTCIYDIFSRISGAGAASIGTVLIINALRCFEPRRDRCRSRSRRDCAAG